MKIRSGFVSNSSSSSFIITDPDITTTAQTANNMLATILDDWYMPEDANWNCNINMVKANKFLLNNENFDEPILIPWSCNYETYIWKNDDDEICVDTSNNHDWNLKYEYNDDWKWENCGPMEGWEDVEFLDLRDMNKKIRDDWSAITKRKEKSK